MVHISFLLSCTHSLTTGYEIFSYHHMTYITKYSKYQITFELQTIGSEVVAKSKTAKLVQVLLLSPEVDILYPCASITAFSRSGYIVSLCKYYCFLQKLLYCILVQVLLLSLEVAILYPCASITAFSRSCYIVSLCKYYCFLQNLLYLSYYMFFKLLLSSEQLFFSVIKNVTFN